MINYLTRQVLIERPMRGFFISTILIFQNYRQIDMLQRPVDQKQIGANLAGNGAAAPAGIDGGRLLPIHGKGIDDMYPWLQGRGSPAAIAACRAGLEPLARPGIDLVVDLLHGWRGGAIAAGGGKAEGRGNQTGGIVGEG